MTALAYPSKFPPRGEAAMFGFVKKAGNWLKDRAEDVQEKAEDIVEDTKEAIDDLQDKGDDLVDDLGKTWNTFSDAWTDAGRKVWQKVKDTQTRIRTVWQNARNPIQLGLGVIGAIAGGVVGIVGAIAGGLVQGVVGTVGAVVQLGGAIIDVGLSWSGTVIDWGLTVAGRLAGLVARTFGARQLGNALEHGLDKLGDGFKEVFQGVGDAWNIIGTTLGKGIAWLGELVGDVISGVLDGLGDWIYRILNGIGCVFGTWGTGHKKTRSMHQIEHFFVVMLENRSLDHMLGFSGLPGIEGPPASFTNTYGGVTVPMSTGAPDKFTPDPPHEFDGVQIQLKPNPDGTPGGFMEAYASVSSDPAKVMKAYSTAKDLPVMYALAKNFAVCDQWFSSLPGPTFPNRYFVHAATSGGLADSPGAYSVLWSSFDGIDFENGDIYRRLEAACVPWAVYHDDLTPQVATLRGMGVGADWFHPFYKLKEHLDAGTLAAGYVFIEPDYGDVGGDFHGGNSQHPVDRVSHGEEFLKRIYEHLRNSEYWKRSALIVIYDEHGGFPDHVMPGAAEPPGDDDRNAEYSSSAAANAFDYSRYGFRIPALVISPWVEPGTVCHTTFDHTSVLKTLEERFDISAMTHRDREANSLAELFTRTQPGPDNSPTHL